MAPLHIPHSRFAARTAKNFMVSLVRERHNRNSWMMHEVLDAERWVLDTGHCC